MNRTTLTAAGLASAPYLLLLDSAVKGTALLVLAAIAAMILSRGSAATRHLVWLLAIVTLLVVPVLSAMLPQWRVLPDWAGIRSKAVVVASGPPSVARPKDGDAQPAQNADPVEVERPSATSHQPALELPDSRPALITPEIVPEPAIRSWSWNNALPLVWAIGFCVLILRLVAARMMLSNSERQATVIWSRRQPASASHDPIVTALEAACSQLGICRPVTLLIHPEKTIPIVWGILRSQLLLPVAARRWSGEQLQSVLLHELAHIKRRDTMAQLLTQVACALHWFNPLVWFAAWRIGAESERACDDLVLASGVRPSAYAGHLLEVVTGLSPARWTQSCGLAMARRSSLEGRLVAVLGENRSRRGVSVALAAIALAVAAGFAVPIAMLRAADEKPGGKAEPATIEMKQKDGAKLEPGTEENLAWGEPVNGLRAAIVFRPSPDQPKAGDMPDLYLAVQNVSNAPVRLSDTTPAPKPRELYIRLDGETVAGIVDQKPTLTDVVLKPREVAFLLVFVSDAKGEDGRTSGSHLAESALEDTHQTLVGEMIIEHAPAGAWTGKLVTGETSGAVAVGRPQPKDKTAQALLKVWQHHARRNGNFPGGLVGRLKDTVKELIRINSGDASEGAYAKKMEPLVPRLDALRDWAPAEVVALLDEIATISPIPLNTTLDETVARTFKTGSPLPPELASAPWGEAQPNGLRMAWLLEPRAAQYSLGAHLPSRVVFHNSGKQRVVFRTRTWHQVGHQARDARGAKIKVDSTEWTTIGRLMSFRLEPGYFVEVSAPGIGIGAMGRSEDWQNARAGSWVAANVGDEVTLTTNPVPLGNGNGEPAASGESHWWLDFIKAHLVQDLPMPLGADERTRLVYRAGMELFGTPISAEEIATFVSDGKPNALDSLAERLAKSTYVAPASGSLTSGPTRFRVLRALPDAAKKTAPPLPGEVLDKNRIELFRRRLQHFRPPAAAAAKTSG